MRNFCANEWARATALKRGGGSVGIPIDWAEAERRYVSETASDMDPEKQYERRWALCLVDRALDNLRGEYERSGNAALFAALSDSLPELGTSRPYREIAQELGINEGALRVATHRLRKRFARVLRREVADTVARPEEVEDELRFLLAALSG
jgi:RNA polymerase sigma-70 factor (ECF subfamily)